MINKNNLALNHQPLTLKSGFTLIEMLVVISLIGILAALAMVSFTSVQKQARDTTRKSDLKQYQTATENYASKNNGIYPIHTTIVTIATGSSLCGSSELNLGACILDPKNASPYQYKYISDTNGTNYVYWGGLEKNTPTVYWVICSNGKVGEKTGSAPSSSTCPI